MKIKLSDIKPSPGALRKTWSEEGLDELAQSIKEHGLIVPIKVRPTNGKYELVYGHRRVKAMRRAGIEEAEAIVDGIDDTNALIQALIENVQREDMNPIDIAKALFQIQEFTGWSQGEMARRGIMPRQTISATMALLREPKSIQDIIVKGGKTGTRGIELGKITREHVTEVRESGLGEDERVQVLDKASKEGLTSAQARRVADTVKAAPSEQAKKKVLEWEYSPTLHDPERVKARAEEFGAHDTMYQDKKPKADASWRDAPEVKAVIDGIRNTHRVILPEWQMTTQKMSPEAKKFIARIVHNLSVDLEVWAQKLEG